MNKQWDVIIVGCGPAGMNAACVLAEQGLQVAVIDEQSDPGGQIFKNISHDEAKERFCEKKTYNKGIKIVQRFLKSNLEYIPNGVVFMIDDNKVYYHKDGQAYCLKALKIVVAVGAMELPVPFSGWTLPGVMAAGTVDTFLKSGASLPQGSYVLAGSGPLMPLVATHLLKKNIKLKAYLDMTPPSNILKASPWLPLALADTPLLLDGAKMLAKIKRSKTYMKLNVSNIIAKGKNKVECITYQQGDKEHEIFTENILYHSGFIPRTHMARALKLEHKWDKRQQCFVTKSNKFGESSNSNVYVIGDCAQVYGEAVASIKGTLCGLHISKSFGVIHNSIYQEEVKKYKKKLCLALAPRNFIDTYFTPRNDLYNAPDDVVVCRCENVTVGDIRKTSLEGLADVNDIKLRTRSGMGICQGRTCGAAAAAIAAQTRNVSIESMGALSIRNPIRSTPAKTILSLEPEKDIKLAR